MKKVELIGEYNTSLGKTFVIKNNLSLKVGDNIHVGDKIYKVKRLIQPTKPMEDELISVVV